MHAPYAITRSALRDGRFEPLSTARFRRALRAGMVVVDVGASFGLYTLIAARAVGRTGQVHAIEPCPDTCVALTSNLRRNPGLAATVHARAAGSRREQRTLYAHRNSTLNGLYPAPAAAVEASLEVDVVPLDELVPGPLDVLKIDVEGAELQVLEGARRLLADSPRLRVLVEWNPTRLAIAGHQPLELLERLRAAGLRVVDAMDESAGRSREVSEVAARIRAGDTPLDWYVNLWAVRDSGPRSG
jgi:FkbM family methyltransferase